MLCSALFADNISSYSEDQLRVLAESKIYGSANDLSYTMAAIASIESEGGLNIINIASKDFGIWQNNIVSVLKRHNLKDTKANRNRFASKLVMDKDFAAKESIDELKYWISVHGRDWAKVWGSYNNGWSFNSKRGRGYASKITKKIKEIKAFETKHGLLEDRFFWSNDYVIVSQNGKTEFLQNVVSLK